MPSAPPRSIVSCSCTFAVVSSFSVNLRFSRDVFPSNSQLASPSVFEMVGTVSSSCVSPRMTISGNFAASLTARGFAVSRRSGGAISHLASSTPGDTVFRMRSNVFTRSSGVRFTSAPR